MLSAFWGTIEIINGNPYVDTPDEILEAIFEQAGKNTSPIPIRGTINDAPFQQSLVRYAGEWRLYINGNMAKAGGLRYTGSIVAIVGKRVQIAIEYDSMPPTYAMPGLFKRALDSDVRAKQTYEQLTVGRKKEILRYLGFLKTQESLERNIARVMQHLRGEESDALYPLMHRAKKK